MADISKTRQLTPKLSVLINSSTGKFCPFNKLLWTFNCIITQPYCIYKHRFDRSSYNISGDFKVVVDLQTVLKCRVCQLVDWQKIIVSSHVIYQGNCKIFSGSSFWNLPLHCSTFQFHVSVNWIFWFWTAVWTKQAIWRHVRTLGRLALTLVCC